MLESAGVLEPISGRYRPSLESRILDTRERLSEVADPVEYAGKLEAEVAEIINRERHELQLESLAVLLHSREIRYVIVDGDDTLVRQPGWKIVPREICARYGKTAEEVDEFWQKTTGMPLAVQYSLLLGITDTEEIKRLCEETFSEVARYGYELLPGTEEFLKTCKRLGKKVFLTSGSDPTLVNKWIDGSNLRQYFAGIYPSTFEDPKSPWHGLLMAMEAGEENFDDFARQTAYFGDGMTDMKIAIAAGIYMPVGLASKPEKRQILIDEGAKVVLNDINEFVTYLESWHVHPNRLRRFAARLLGKRAELRSHLFHYHPEKHHV